MHLNSKHNMAKAWFVNVLQLGHPILGKSTTVYNKFLKYIYMLYIYIIIIMINRSIISDIINTKLSLQDWSSKLKSQWVYTASTDHSM